MSRIFPLHKKLLFLQLGSHKNMPLVRFAHSCHIFMTSQTRGNILYTTGITLYYPIIRQYTTASRVINEYTTGGDQMVSNLLGKKVYACGLK